MAEPIRKLSCCVSNIPNQIFNNCANIKLEKNIENQLCGKQFHDTGINFGLEVFPPEKMKDKWVKFIQYPQKILNEEISAKLLCSSDEQIEHYSSQVGKWSNIRGALCFRILSKSYSSNYFVLLLVYLIFSHLTHTTRTPI